MSTIDLSSPPPHHRFSVSIEREEIAAEHRVRLFKGSVLIVKHIRFKFRSCVQAVPGAGSCGVRQPRFSKRINAFRITR
ncbi:MAG: hypothetical protein U1E35_03920 [Rhodospirillales bacterium]